MVELRSGGVTAGVNSKKTAEGVRREDEKTAGVRACKRCRATGMRPDIW